MPRQFIPYLKWPVAAFIVGAFLSTVYFWPMSYWLDVRTVHINDARVGADITMLVDRDVKHSFFGTFSVTVHRWHNNGPEAYCSARGGEWDYQKGAVYPVPLTLYWWTEKSKACSQLPAGQYQVTTRWTNLGAFLPLPNKTLTVTSNIFTVAP